jgi:ABC-type nickel/cobalt efflux system permease component RcnA
MLRPLTLAALVLGVIAAWLWVSGGFDALVRLAAEAQREFQTGMARILRSLKAGEAGTILALVTVSFGYGVAHAAGPGHGKLVVGGYGVARRVRLVPLVAIALASGLAQATVAVAIVAAGLAVLGWGREELALADRWLAPASYGLIGLLGLWIVWRGVAHLRPGVPGPLEDGHHHHHEHTHTHAHTHAHAHAPAPSGTEDHTHAHGAGCGHAHAPGFDEMARVTSLREAALLIAGVALRPCTGALFILILTAQMGIFGAGIAGAYAMGLGTGAVMAAVAVAAVTLREGALAGVAGAGALGRVLPVVEIAAGGLIALASIVLMTGSL